MSDGIERKRQLLMAELQRYFGETCLELVARCEAALSRGPPGAVLRLLGNLKELEAVTNKANRQVKAALAASGESSESAEPLLDRAFATLEHLNELAKAILSQLDE
jgi:hypothetical protein